MTSRYWPQLVLRGLLSVGLLVVDSLSPAGRQVIQISGLDPVYYFGTVHSLLFDRDFDLTNQIEVFPPADYTGRGGCLGKGKPGSPYALGYSLLAIPFLLLGTFAEILAGGPATGYSSVALTVYFLANIVFAMTGLILLFLFLCRYPNQGVFRWLCLGTTLSIWAGTSRSCSRPPCSSAPRSFC